MLTKLNGHVLILSGDHLQGMLVTLGVLGKLVEHWEHWWEHWLGKLGTLGTFGTSVAHHDTLGITTAGDTYLGGSITLSSTTSSRS